MVMFPKYNFVLLLFNLVQGLRKCWLIIKIRQTTRQFLYFRATKMHLSWWLSAWLRFKTNKFVLGKLRLRNTPSCLAFVVNADDSEECFAVANPSIAQRSRFWWCCYAAVVCRCACATIVCRCATVVQCAAVARCDAANACCHACVGVGDAAVDWCETGVLCIDAADACSVTAVACSDAAVSYCEAVVSRTSAAVACWNAAISSADADAVVASSVVALPCDGTTSVADWCNNFFAVAVCVVMKECMARGSTN